MMLDRIFEGQLLKKKANFKPEPWYLSIGPIMGGQTKWVKEEELIGPMCRHWGQLQINLILIWSKPSKMFVQTKDETSNAFA